MPLAPRTMGVMVHLAVEDHIHGASLMFSMMLTIESSPRGKSSFMHQFLEGKFRKQSTHTAGGPKKTSRKAFSFWHLWAIFHVAPTFGPE